MNKVNITLEIDTCQRCPHGIDDTWSAYEMTCSLVNNKTIPWAPLPDVMFPIPDWCPLLSVKSETVSDYDR